MKNAHINFFVIEHISRFEKKNAILIFSWLGCEPLSTNKMTAFKKLIMFINNTVIT